MAEGSLLLKGALALLPSADGSVSQQESDILVGTNGDIVWVRAATPAEEDSGIQVRDCRGLIAMPGLIDTHRHVGVCGEEA